MKKRQLTPNRNNIETYLPIFHGFYGSIWDEPDFYGEAEHFGLPSNFPFWDYVQWGDYKNALSKKFCNKVESALSEFIERIDYQRLVSPKEYNFTNDSIYCVIRPKKAAIKEYIYKNKEAFSKYLKDRLTSRDGFISWHSNQFNQWEIDTKNFTRFDKAYDTAGFNLGFVLEFIAANEEIDESILYETECYISEYYSDEFYSLAEIVKGANMQFINKPVLDNMLKSYSGQLPNVNDQIEQVKKFVRENYMKPNIETLTLQEFTTEENEILNLVNIVSAVCKEIESLTLNLPL